MGSGSRILPAMMRARAGAIVLALAASGCDDAINRQQMREQAHAPADVVAEVARLQPDVAAWYHEAERVGLANGHPLNARQMQVALRAGVKDPGRVRLVIGVALPPPSNPHMLDKMTPVFGALAKPPAASTFGYAVYLDPRYAHDRYILAHELTHVGQFERLGIDGFVHDYLLQLMLFGRLRAPLEREAAANENLGE
ncbi:MAG TPA: DUF4157 domain-containing protein [Xanthomonadaceae bacterium]|jgi:hypothetical protein